MIRGRILRKFSVFRLPVLGLLGLLLAVCLLEIGWRVRRAWVPSRTHADGDSAQLITPDAFCHHRVRPFARITRGGTEVEFNSFGLRGPEPAIPKPTNTVRVLCLGDEQVLAPRTSDSFLFTSVLQQRLNEQGRTRYEVLNAGVPGHSPLLNYLWYRHHLLGLEPDVVVLVIRPAAVAEDARYRRLARVDGVHGPLACTHPQAGGKPLDRWRRTLDEFLVARQLVTWGSQLVSGPSDPGSRRQLLTLAGDPARLQAAVVRSLRPVVYLRRMTQRRGVRLIVIPGLEPSEDAAGSEPQAVLRVEMQSLNRYGIEVPAAPGHGATNEQRSDWFYPGSSDLSPRGHGVIAETLAKAVLSPPMRHSDRR